MCLSGGKKCTIFGKFGKLCFLVTSLRFSLLLYCRRFTEVIQKPDKHLRCSFLQKLLAAFSFFSETLHHRPRRCISKDAVNIFMKYYDTYPGGIYLLKVNNRNARTRFEICSKLKLVSAIFCEIFIFSPNDSPSKVRKIFHLKSSFRSRDIQFL